MLLMIQKKKTKALANFNRFIASGNFVEGFFYGEYMFEDNMQEVDAS